jgi:hypothetical protein
MSGVSRIDPNDLVGARVNWVTVVAYLGKLETKYHHYLIQCDCGTEKKALRHQLAGKRLIESCGCVARMMAKAIGERFRTHGLSNTSINNRWSGMMARCYQPTNKKYARYGGRGIKVCERWHAFENFFEDMGHPPSRAHSLDRIDVHGDYSKENCRWATQKTQQNNRENNRVLTINGVSKPLTVWAEEAGISYRIVRQRIDRDHWTPERALSEKPTRARPMLRNRYMKGTAAHPALAENITPVHLREAE